MVTVPFLAPVFQTAAGISHLLQTHIVLQHRIQTALSLSQNEMETILKCNIQLSFLTERITFFLLFKHSVPHLSLVT